MKNVLALFLSLFPLFALSQTRWTSPTYKYSIEIPKGFTQTTSVVGANVDFKATKGLSSVVIVMKTLPQEYASNTIWQLLGDLTTYGAYWEAGAKEYMDNPKFLKYGKTTISNQDAFWFDYTTDNPKLYSKTYQTKKGRKLYTITLTSPFNEHSSYSAIWLRFKNQMII